MNCSDLKTSRELSLGQTEGMAEMKDSIHVGIWEGDEELLLVRVRGWIRVEGFRVHPKFLDFPFDV